MNEGIPANAYPHRFRVSPEDVDVQGRVSNDVYVRYLSAAAVAHSNHLGWDTERYRSFGAWWVVRRHEVDYVVPARGGDDLICYTWPSAVSKAKAERRHVIVRPADGALIMRAMNVWALIDVATERPRRIAPEMLETFDPSHWRMSDPVER